MKQNPLKALDYSVLQQCMHCGMCLPSCPTYVKTGLERHSPRGRIALMRAIADDELKVGRTFAEEMHFCLGCLACTSACPAGVDYVTLFETARFHVEEEAILASPGRSFIRWVTMRFLFVHPRALKFAGRLLRLYQRSGMQRFARSSGLLKLLPKKIGELEPLTPEIRTRFSEDLIEPIERPKSGKPRYKVLVLTGCMQDLMFSEINRATVDVLLENGCEVHTPRLQHCCGSLHAHNGDQDTAKKLARLQLDRIDPFSYDAIISNAGGCGSHLSRYDHLLGEDQDYRERAAEWSRKLKDIHAWLVHIDFRKPCPKEGGADLRVTYHESCHLCHGQKVSQEPREILRALPGVKLVELPEANWCCGSAGVYNIVQPETADWLLRRKLENIKTTEAGLIVTANPGCHLQLQNGLKQAPTKQVVKHVVELLGEGYRRERE